uniref:Origin recognition complex subunit 5 C-terminal domain-containing protein n=1 Tax=Globisporangium ultimum (strain ATCC 200006 / CBS 805.95 / DAOM BR144) TaxID=431595 RepID=K3X5T7_GLOUD
MIGRERELAELQAVVALHDEENERGERIYEEPAPLVIVYGGASTGKSMCVTQALHAHAEMYAMVDCTAVYSAQEFYREILVQLYKNQRSAVSRYDANGTRRGSGADAAFMDHGEPHDELMIEDAGNGEEAADSTGKRHGNVDAEKNSSRSDDNSEYGDSDEDDDHHGFDKKRTVANTKRIRARQQAQQQQRATEANKDHVDYEGYNSLNFLSFIKAFGNFVDSATPAEDANENATSSADAERRVGDQAVQSVRSDAMRRKRVVYLALDQVDKLLDRGHAALLTCVFTINDQLSYLNMFTGVQWDVCVILITRAMSLEFDQLVSAFLPAYIPFSPYSPDQIADILVDQLHMQPVARIFRKWLLHLSTLLPPSHDDWLEFRRNVVHLLPDFKVFFSLVSAAEPASSPAASLTAATNAKKLMRTTNERVGAFEKTRRKHLFGYDKLQRSNGDPTDSISCTDLSRSCLLLIIAGYLASFNPQDTDTNFLSSSGGGTRRKKRAKKSGQSSAAAAEQISQLLIGPRIFKLQRLLAIYLNLRAEASADITDQFSINEAREDIFTHLATLVRMQLFQRTSPPNMLDDIKFRCLADSRFVQETARFLRFPLESYLNTNT